MRNTPNGDICGALQYNTMTTFLDLGINQRDNSKIAEAQELITANHAAFILFS